MLLDGLEQRHGLVAVARFQRVREANGAALDGILEMADDQALAHLGDAAVAEFDHLGEVVAGVDVNQRKGKATRVDTVAGMGLEGLLGQAQDDAGILAAGKQQGRALEGGHGFAQR